MNETVVCVPAPPPGILSDVGSKPCSPAVTSASFGAASDFLPQPGAAASARVRAEAARTRWQTTMVAGIVARLEADNAHREREEIDEHDGEVRGPEGPARGSDRRAGGRRQGGR